MIDDATNLVTKGLINAEGDGLVSKGILNLKIEQGPVTIRRKGGVISNPALAGIEVPKDKKYFIKVTFEHEGQLITEKNIDIYIVDQKPKVSIKILD